MSHPATSHRRARREEVSSPPTFGQVVLFQRDPDKPRLTKEQMQAARRVKELSRIYYDQFPNGLPHNGLGVKYAKYICRTMAFLPNDRRAEWLDRHADWLGPETRGYILSFGPYWYSARSLGNKLELENKDRERLQTWSIEAIDVTYEERQMINKEKKRQDQEKRRRRNGAKPRIESASRTKPWIAAGYSTRRTWERHGKPVAAPPKSE
jgi:hypothetical protein